MRTFFLLCLVTLSIWQVKASDQYDNPQTWPNRTVMVQLFGKRLEVWLFCKNKVFGEIAVFKKQVLICNI